MSTQGRRPEVLDLVTGAVSAPPEFEEELEKADPGFVNGVGADLCYGYGQYRLVNVNYFLEAGAKQFSHIFAFTGDKLVGRIECVNEQVLVFKAGVKTFETTRPQSGGGVFRFPQDVEPLSDSEPGWQNRRQSSSWNASARTRPGSSVPWPSRPPRRSE